MTGAVSKRLAQIVLSTGWMFLGGGAVNVLGDDGSWTSNAAGTWSASANWLDGIIADGAGATAWFTNNITVARTITLDGAAASRTLGNLNVGDSVSGFVAFNFIATDGGTLTFDNAPNGTNAQLNQTATAAAQKIGIPLVLASTLVVSNASANLLSITNGIAGTGDIIFVVGAAGGIACSLKAVDNCGAIVNAGGGDGSVTISAGIGTNATAVIQDSGTSPLILSGACVYMCDTVISNGTLKLGAANVIPEGPDKGNVLVNGVLDMNGYADTINGLSGPGMVDNSAGAAVTLKVGSNDQSSVFAGIITNTGGTASLALMKVGAGTLVLTGENGHGGLTTVGNGVLNIQNGKALGTTNGGTTVSAGAALQLQGDIAIPPEVLTLNGGGIADDGALRSLNGTNVWNGAIALAGASRIHCDGGALILSNAISGAFDLTISGTGMVVLAGASTYTGGTIIETGMVLQVVNTNGSATGSGAVTINAGAALEGDGRLADSVVTNSYGAVLAPGRNDAPGRTLSLSRLAWNGGGILRCRVACVTNNEAGAGVDYGYLLVSDSLIAAPNGTNLVIRMDSMEQVLEFQGTDEYRLKLIACATNLSLSPYEVTLETNAFLVGGTWGVMTRSNSLYVIYTANPPGVDNGAGATDVGFGMATLNGTLSTAVSANIFISWWTNGGSVTNLLDFGAPRVEGAFSTNLTGLEPGTTYGYQCYVSNSYGTAISDPTNFTTVALGHRYVASTGGSAPYEGSSWAHPYTSIQEAINAASAGENICVKVGSYYAMQISGKALTVRGGYAGTGPEPGPYTNDPALTICDPNQPYNGSARALYVSANSNCLVENMTLRRGAAGYTGTGSGVFVQNSTNMMRNCVIEANVYYGTKGVGVGVAGGKAIFEHCVIRNNNGGTSYSGSGGGIYVNGGAAQFRSCVVNGNRHGYGSAISVASGTAIMFNCLVQNNTDINANGGSVYASGGTLVFSNCTVAANSPIGLRAAGGAVSAVRSIIWNNGDDVYGTPTLASCDIEDGDNNGTNGCFSADPQFTMGFYLADESPCIDTGDVTAASAEITNLYTQTSVPDTGMADLGYHYNSGIEASDLYVANSGSDTNEGTLASPFKTVTYALSRALNGTRIHIAAGTYNPSSGESYPFAITKDCIQLLGTNAATTILDANASGASGIRVVIINGLVDIVLEGVTLKRGISPYSTPGSGLYARNSIVTVRNCIVEANGYYGTSGVGAYIEGGSTLFDQCRIRNNVGGSSYGGSGGGLYLNGGYLNVRSCLFTGNKHNSGSAAFIADGNAIFRNCLFTNNANGSCISGAGGTISIENCTMVNNSPVGIQAAGGVVAVKSSIVWANGDDIAGEMTLTYCDIGDGDNNGTNGCLNIDPLFQDTTYYHLCSQAGVYTGGYFSGGGWLNATSTSLLLDAGDPTSDYSLEPSHPRGRIEMGMYGNTSTASETPFRGTVFVTR